MIYNILSFASVFKTVWSIALALLILLFMITVHEFGHYIAGKIFKFKINEFAIGFGPALYKKQRKNGEFFSVRALPLGGYCAFEGEDENNNHPDAFNNKKPWQRIIVLISGALMNFISALLIIIISFMMYGQLLMYVGGTQDTNDSLVSAKSFSQGDIIIKAQGKNVYLITDLMEILKNKNKGDEVDFLVSRKDGEKRVMQNIQIILREDINVANISDYNAIYKGLGIAESDNFTQEKPSYELYSYSYKFGFFEAIGRSFAYAFKIAGTIFTVLGQLFTGKLGVSTLGGPVSTISMTSKIASMGLQQLFEIAAFIGVNLAVFNLLPLPALDGSRAVFAAIEWIFKKPVNRKIEGVIHFAGFVFLIGFALLVDLLKLF